MLDWMNSLMTQECIARYSTNINFLCIHGREFKNKQKTLLSWCIIYCNCGSPVLV